LSEVSRVYKPSKMGHEWHCIIMLVRQIKRVDLRIGRHEYIQDRWIHWLFASELWGTYKTTSNADLWSKKKVGQILEDMGIE